LNVLSPPATKGRGTLPAAQVREREAAAPYLSIRNLSKSFGAFTALREISLDVARGAFVCFLGPSGCGKTTLLRCIAGLDRESAGSIRQDGREITRLPPAQRDFGIVFQSFALFPNLTVAANVGYGLKSRGLKKADIVRRVADLLTLVGLPDAGRKYPVQLSGGQQQRVALARALALEPGLLLLDEPLSALDARVRLRLRHEIRALHRRLGITTIMVTHDQEEALTMADTIVVMNHGVIEQIGSPEEIYRRPLSPFVADFVGTMNLLAGTVAAPGQVAIGSAVLACPAAEGLPEGARVSLSLRPEDIQVRGVAAQTPNRLDATIADLEFLGSFCRATLALDDAPAAALLADFSINLVRDLELGKGQRLAIALPPERIRVFGAE
jgi:iron(III) transport system ATP-binding protein